MCVVLPSPSSPQSSEAVLRDGYPVLNAAKTLIRGLKTTYSIKQLESHWQTFSE